jgi:hypothetical protein
VVEEYFDPKTRTVAIYRTKKVEPSGIEGVSGEDAELTAVLAPLSPAMQERFRHRLRQISTMGAEQLEIQAALALAAMEVREIPDEQKPAVEYVVRKMKERAEALRAAEPASQDAADEEE